VTIAQAKGLTKLRANRDVVDAFVAETIQVAGPSPGNECTDPTAGATEGFQNLEKIAVRFGSHRGWSRRQDVRVTALSIARRWPLGAQGPSPSISLQLAQAVVANAEVVGKLMEDSPIYLLHDLSVGRAIVFDGLLEDRYFVREDHPVVGVALGERDTFVETVQSFAGAEPRPSNVVAVGSGFDDNGDVVEICLEFGRELTDRSLD